MKMNNADNTDGKIRRVNKKILAMTGDTILAGEKAEKMLGDALSAKDRRKMLKAGMIRHFA